MSYSGQVVDTQTAQEFMEQTLESITRSELGDIVSELDQKAERFAALLSREHLPELTESELLGILRHVFATRRRARHIVDALGVEFFRASIMDLLYGVGNPAQRFQAFVLASGQMVTAERGDDSILLMNSRCDLAAELLHFTDPHNYWLWARWMWDQNQKTGSLPLVVEEDYDFSGASPGEIYGKVGIAVAFVKATGEAAGFSKLTDSPFDIDVFLACVYAVYMYTTLRMRMTQEFNKVVPNLPELVRRLLGTWRFDL